jgi:uncharacterized membrane protein
VSYYGVLLFLHILSAAIWFGGGFLLIVLSARMTRLRDNQGLESLFRQADFIAMRIFIPASLVVLALGILLVIEGPWTFGSLWILIGLGGYAATFVTGVFLLTPQSKRIAAAIDRDGGMTEESAAETARLFQHMRIEYAVLAVVIADMALKPTVDDIATLALFAAVIAVVAVLTLRGGRKDRPAVSPG